MDSDQNFTGDTDCPGSGDGLSNHPASALARAGLACPQAHPRDHRRGQIGADRGSQW